MTTQTIKGQIVDILQRRIYPASLEICDGVINAITPITDAPNQYILPGFIDAHVHIESSMLVPTEFARLAVTHGTIATVSDPHEIANVCGIDGVQYMIDNSKKSPFKFFFGAPSCVPATGFETSGATIDSKGIENLIQNPDIWYLAEMMNYPGVLFDDEEIIKKINATKKTGKPIDGHAPGLRGEDVIKYAGAGISTDHECFTLEEAIDKLNANMKIIIREGSAAKNFEALHSLISTHPQKVMFCSDDKHPDELVISHINQLVKRGLAMGHDLFDVLTAACINPVAHYNLPVGQLQVGDPADFIIVKDLESFEHTHTYINGALVAQNGASLLDNIKVEPINNFDCNHRTPSDFSIKTDKQDMATVNVIEAIDGQLITNKISYQAKITNGIIESNVEDDILKIAVINRYDKNASVSKAFIKGFGLKQGAIASTVAHDCHNIVVIGVDDKSICLAVNKLIDCKGGISIAYNDNQTETLPLPIAGLMTNIDGYKIANQYSDIDKKAKELGSDLQSPFMTLSFMALLVIPSLKLSDKGLFDGQKFEFTSIEA